MKIRTATPEGKFLYVLVLALIVFGLLGFSGIGEVIRGEGVAAKIFLVFFGAIIVMQVIPGVLLMGAMIKGLTSLTRRERPKQVK